MPGWISHQWQDFNKGQGEKSAYTRLIEKEKGELWRSAVGTRGSDSVRMGGNGDGMMGCKEKAQYQNEVLELRMDV